MIAPNKVVSVEESALALSTLILRCGPNPWPLAQLYRELSDDFESIDQFLLAVDLLYVLGRIVVDMETGVLSYAHIN